MIPHRAPVAIIVACVAEHFGLTPQIFTAKRHDRGPRYARPRHVAMYLMLRAGYSTTEAAREMNKSDHTTAMYARDRVAAQIVDAAFAAAIDDITSAIALTCAARRGAFSTERIA